MKKEEVTRTQAQTHTHAVRKEEECATLKTQKATIYRDVRLVGLAHCLRSFLC